MQKTARLSDCRRFRYLLTRSWGEGGAVCFIGANPSVADDQRDDPTIRREIAFAVRMGASKLLKVNLSPYIATDPRAHAQWLKEFAGRFNHPWLDENIKAIREACEEARGNNGLGIIAAWGNVGADMLTLRDAIVPIIGSPVMCLGFTKSGEPRHPLYLPKEAPIQRWR